VPAAAERSEPKASAAQRKPADRRDVELAKARKVIEIQGNVSSLLEQMLGTEGERPSTER